MNVQVGMQVILPAQWQCVYTLLYLHNGKVDFCLPAQYDKA